MKCFYAPESEGHDPQFRLTHGTVVRNAERAERAMLLLEGLGRLGLGTESPPEAPRTALEAVHTPEFLHFLETAWDAWQELPNAGPEVVANVFPRGHYNFDVWVDGQYQPQRTIVLSTNQVNGFVFA